MKNKQLTDDQVNLICAAFEGLKYPDHQWDIYGNLIESAWYTESLDSLVPIWGSMDQCLKSFGNNNGFRITGLDYAWIISVNENGDKDMTLSQAAAHATALAILELNPELREYGMVES